MGVVGEEEGWDVFSELLVRDELQKFILVPCLDDQFIGVMWTVAEVDLQSRQIN